MATSGKTVDAQIVRDVKHFVNELGFSISETARRLGLSRPTVRKYLKSN